VADNGGGGHTAHTFAVHPSHCLTPSRSPPLLAVLSKKALKITRPGSVIG
jgi:hypothetical protein